MKKLFVSALALLATVTLSAQDITALFNEGTTSFNNKDFKGAASKFEEVLKLGDDNEDAEEVVNNAGKYLGICFHKLAGSAAAHKQYDEALEHCKKSIEISKEYNPAQVKKTEGMMSKVCFAKGAGLLNEKNYEGAIDVLKDGFELRPNDARIALALARAYCEAGEFVDGMDVYEQILAKGDNPKYAEPIAQAKQDMAIYTNNQIAKMQGENDFDGMLEMAEKMLEKNAQSPIAHSVRLQAYTSKKSFDKVIEYGEEAAAAQTDDEAKSQMYFFLGAAYNAKEMPQQAVAAFRKVTAGPNVEGAKQAIASLAK